MNWHGYFKDWEECQEIVIDWADSGILNNVSSGEIERLIHEIQTTHVDQLKTLKAKHNTSGVNQLMTAIRRKFLFRAGARLLNSSIVSQIPKTRDKINYYKHNEEEE